MEQITIKEAVKNILNKEWLIPDFQRDFVWDKDRITNLWDSIMRGYSIASLLLWEIQSEETAQNLCRFYPFVADQDLSEQKFPNPISNDVPKFSAVLDGQQRLTSLLIGLKGSISEKKWNKDSKYHLYLCLSETKNREGSAFAKKYDFQFHKDTDTNASDIYSKTPNEIWFRVSKIMDFNKSSDVNAFCREHGDINEEGQNIIAALWGKIHTKEYLLTYDTQSTQEDAINMFLRINTGVKSLTMADIILSIITTKWGDVRKNIKSLIGNINGKGFKVSTDFIVKCLLCIYGTSVKYQPSSITDAFVNNIKTNWKEINDTMVNLFNMLVGFGFANKKFALNVLTPIFCYLYWNKKNTISAITYKDKVSIHKWLLKTIILKSFSSATDTRISEAIKTFDKGKNQYPAFPANEISKEMKQGSLSQNEIENQLDDLQFGDNDTYFVLSLLQLEHFDFTQPHDIDHLHPKENINNGVLSADQCNSILNLHLLDRSSNQASGKGSLPLDAWIYGTTSEKQIQIKRDSFIPTDESLDVKDFDAFCAARKKLMVSELLGKLK